ncbi:MAG: hypothetical protein CVV49_22065, partial [Spirochaetae bacterium HGW-Spirochaetae-5]
GCEITISGEPLIIQSLAKYIVYGQLWSLFLSLAAVSLVVIVLFRNIKAGFVALVPIGLALLFNFGVMGWMGIKLDIATAIIASITVGIGVDNTIHFLNNYRVVSRDKTLSFNETLTVTLSIAGKAIIYAALALICGFSVLVVSSFKPIMLFGILMGVTFIATTAGALLVLPAFIKAVNFSMDEDTAPADFEFLKTGAAVRLAEKLISSSRRIGGIYSPVKMRYERIMAEKVIPLLKRGE